MKRSEVEAVVSKALEDARTGGADNTVEVLLERLMRELEAAGAEWEQE